MHMAGFESKSPEELTILSLLLAFSVSENNDADELNVLGNWIVAVGSLILTWAAQKQYLETAQETSQQKDAGTAMEDIKQQIKDLQEKYSKLEESLKKGKQLAT
jgi:hypothetical protein